jgi:hypothetical protein
MSTFDGFSMFNVSNRSKGLKQFGDSIFFPRFLHNPAFPKTTFPELCKPQTPSPGSFRPDPRELVKKNRSFRASYGGAVVYLER